MCPEGHVAQEKWKAGNGTLGARSASLKACHTRETNEASGTLGEPSAS